MNRALLFALLLGTVGCETSDPCSGVADLALSPAGLTLTQGEHVDGWGHDECFQCHQAWRIHRVSCSSFDGEPGLIDLEAIADRADPNDTTTCVSCHGANGVPGWDALLDDSEAGQ